MVGDIPNPWSSLYVFSPRFLSSTCPDLLKGDLTPFHDNAHHAFMTRRRHTWKRACSVAGHGKSNHCSCSVCLSILMEPKIGGPYAKISRGYGNIFTA